MKNKIYCSYCGSTINELDDEDVPIVVLKIGYVKEFFCDDNCLELFIDEHTDYSYVKPSGEIEE